MLRKIFSFPNLQRMLIMCPLKFHCLLLILKIWTSFYLNLVNFRSVLNFFSRVIFWFYCLVFCMIAPPIPNLLMIKSLVLAIVVSSQMLLISESGDESLLNCLDKVNPKTTVLMREQTNKQKKITEEWDMLKRRQKLEWCGHKLSDAKGYRMLQEQAKTCPIIFRLRRRGSRAGKDWIGVVSDHPVCDHFFHQF